MRSHTCKLVGFILIIGFLLFSVFGCGSTGGMDDGTGGDGGETPTEPSFNFTGTVFGTNGSPSSGVTISVFSPGYTTTTNSDGIFSLNVSNDMHTLLASKAGYVESYQLADLSAGGSVDRPVVLMDSPVAAVNVLANTGTPVPLTSNSIEERTGSLFIPAQASGTFTIGNQSGLTNADISFINLDLNSPLPAPMPTPSNTPAEAFNGLGGKKAPRVLFSFQPGQLTMGTAAILTFPPIDGFTISQVLRFDPETHRWQVFSNVAENSIAVTRGGLFGAFYEEPRSGSIRGTANPGSIVLVGDEVIDVGADGTFFVNEVPVPPTGPVTVIGLGPADPETGVRSVIQAQVDLEPGGQAFVTLNQVAVGSISVSAASDTVVADGETQVAIVAEIFDAEGNPIVGDVSVSFSTTAGSLSSTSAKAAGGSATVNLISSTNTGATATVTASVGGFSDSVVVRFIPVPESLSVSASQISVKTDNSDSATITAEVLNSNNAPFAGVSVSFSVDSGVLRSATELAEGEQFDPTAIATGTDGIAQVVFSTGTANKANRIVNITVKVGGLPAKVIPIQVTGTTVDKDNDKTSLDVEGSNQATLTITVLDASLTPVFDVPIEVSASPENSLRWSTSDGNLRTDVSGKVTLTVAGNQVAEEAVLRVDALGASATQTYSVSSAADLFGIISPDTDPYALLTNQTLSVVVRAPDQNQVRFSTTFGTWQNGSKSVDVNVSNNTATAQLSSTEAGLATVQVFDVNNPNTTDTLQVAIAAPSSEASQIALQLSSGVVQPSTGEVRNTVTLRATVKNATDQVVAGAPVLFSLENTTGGGEIITPVIVYTNSQGVATSTFFSGSLSSGANGISIKASVVGKPAVQDIQNLIIGGTAGSVVIGQASVVEASEDNTYYRLPMSAVVSDANGNPVSGAKVTLGAWPLMYSTGFWDQNTEPCEPVIGGTFSNEDALNRNLILDPGEDANGDGELTPPNSAAGNVIPPIVTTDENGVASFDLVYLKQHAVWIVDEIRASTLVSGTETQSTLVFRLGYIVEESCNLPPSPFSADIPPGNITLTTDKAAVLANGVDEATITATLRDFTGGAPEDGTVVNFNITSGQGGFPIAQQASAVAFGGIATVTYRAPKGSFGSVSIVATATGFNDSNTLTMTLSAGEVILSTSEGSTTLAANGTDSLIILAQVIGADGLLVDTPDRVNFSVSGPGGFPTTTTAVAFAETGVASVQYVGGTTPGTATITARTESGASDTLTVTLLDDTAGAIELSSIPETAANAPIPADGQTSARIIAAVTNKSGVPVPIGTAVIFSTNLGSLSQTNVTTTDAQGFAEVSLVSDQAGTAQVTAQSGSAKQTISIHFSSVIETGLPVGESLSITATLNIVPEPDEAIIDVSATDKFGNPVPDTTVFSFKTYNTGGLITPGIANTVNGFATNTLIAVNSPQTINNTVSVTAETEGDPTTTHITSLAVVRETDFNQIIYAGTNGGGVYKSADSGATWVNFSRSYLNSRYGQNWMDPYIKGHSAISVDPDDKNIVYVGTGYLGEGKVFKSIDGGLNWNSGNIQQQKGLKQFDAAVLTVLADGKDYESDENSPWLWLWIGTEGEGVYYSDDGGETFQQSSRLGSGRVVWDIARISDTHGPTAFLYAGAESGVYKSIDGGQNWFEITATSPPPGFIGDSIKVLKVYPNSTGGQNDIIFVGTEDSGVWSTTDGGASWTNYKSGIVNGRTIKDLLVDPTNDFLYAVTYYLDPVTQDEIGNVYVHELDSTGAMTPGDWFEANNGISPEFADGSLYGQYALAIDNQEDPLSSPRTLFVGGAGIGFHKATNGLTTGSPAWVESNSGLTNILFAREPVSLP